MFIHFASAAKAWINGTGQNWRSLFSRFQATCPWFDMAKGEVCKNCNEMRMYAHLMRE